MKTVFKFISKLIRIQQSLTFNNFKNLKIINQNILFFKFILKA